MGDRLRLYFHTIRHLRWIQIWYRIYYFLRGKWRKTTDFRYPLQCDYTTALSLRYTHIIPSKQAWNPADNTFVFLNQLVTFGQNIDWNYEKNGKLWQYNLHYFEYLLQDNITAEQGIKIIEDFIENLPTTPKALEPYPTSLRILFWIQFLSKFQIQHILINRSLRAQTDTLADQLEYHIQANHLIENAFAWTTAALYFQDKNLYTKAERLLSSEIKTQILSSGAHYERSPMYHQIMLHRVLDLYGLLQVPNSINLPTTALKNLLREKVFNMLSWIQHMTYPNGTVARFNDSTDGIAPTTATLIHHASKLGIEAGSWTSMVDESGYFWRECPDYHLIADLGSIGPDYQPGHAHCDLLSFEMHVKSQPILVNTGISTYEKNARRQYERSTAAHNTVQVNEEEQVAIWGGFRVGKRVKPRYFTTKNNETGGFHDGFFNGKIRHTRYFDDAYNQVNIKDEISILKPVNTPLSPKAYFHFHPSVLVMCRDNVVQTEWITMTFEGLSHIALETYQYAQGFNDLVDAQRVVVQFDSVLHTNITIQ